MRKMREAFNTVRSKPADPGTVLSCDHPLFFENKLTGAYLLWPDGPRRRTWTATTSLRLTSSS